MGNTETRFDGLMQRFAEAAADPLGSVSRWKAAHAGKAVGCVGLHVPEEIISAAGMLPVMLLEKDGPLAHADAHVQNNMCGYIRSIADQALAGQLSGLDSLVILDSCHVIRMIGDSLRHSADQVARIDFLYLPVSLQRSEANKYLGTEIAGFAERMAAVAGRPITEADLDRAIRMHNDNRRLLQRLYSLRRGKPGLIGAVQVATVVKASMCMPKDEHSAILAELLTALEQRTAPSLTGAVPIVVSGSLCESCDDILVALEKSGATIVDDDLFVGSRYFGTLVDESMPPLQALAQAYASQSAPCPTITRTERALGDYLGDMAERAKAAGVVSVVVKYCEPHYYSYLMLRRKLKQRSIPETMVEKERAGASEGQLRTRVQAFVESIETECAR